MADAVLSSRRVTQVRELKNRGRILSTETLEKLQALWHYDPNYPYDPDRYVYADDHTTDPYYIKDDLLLAFSFRHSILMEKTVGNIREYSAAVAKFPWVLTSERSISRLPYVNALGYCLDSVVPDLSLWASGTHVEESGSIPWDTEGAPLLVLECLSDSTRVQDTQRKPCIYYEMGIQEYYICDPDPEAAYPLLCWQRTQKGDWIQVQPNSKDGTIYSPVLQTQTRLDKTHGFQIYDSQTGTWPYRKSEKEVRLQLLLETASRFMDWEDGIPPSWLVEPLMALPLAKILTPNELLDEVLASANFQRATWHFLREAANLHTND